MRDSVYNDSRAFKLSIQLREARPADRKRVAGNMVRVKKQAFRSPHHRIAPTVDSSLVAVKDTVALFLQDSSTCEASVKGMVPRQCAILPCWCSVTV